MGTDIKDNTVFLEFYGLPGSGKSTISHLVAEELRRQGKKVSEPTYELDHLYSNSKRRLVKLLQLIRYAATHPKNYKKLMQLVKANGYGGSEVISQAANIASKLWMYEKSKTDYVIFDEGITQSAISLCQGKMNSVDNEAELYSLCRKRMTRKFYIKVDKETALERMANRGKHDSRIEKIDDEAGRIDAITAFERQCNAISSGLIIQGRIVDESVVSVIRQICTIR